MHLHLTQHLGIRSGIRSVIRSVMTVLLLIATLSLVACGPSGPPILATARIVDAPLAYVSEEAIAIRFEVEVDNPYPSLLPLREVAWEVVSPTQPRGFVIAGRKRLPESEFVDNEARKRIILPIVIDYAELVDFSTLTWRDRVPYTAKINIESSIRGLGPVTFPLIHQSYLPNPIAPPPGESRTY